MTSKRNMNAKTTRISFWMKEGKHIVKQYKKRRPIDVAIFKLNHVHYTLFMNNLEDTFSLVAKCPNHSSKNYLLLNSPAHQNLKTIKKEILKNLKQYKNHDIKFKNYLKSEYNIKRRKNDKL